MCSLCSTVGMLKIEGLIKDNIGYTQSRDTGSLLTAGVWWVPPQPQAHQALALHCHKNSMQVKPVNDLKFESPRIETLFPSKKSVQNWLKFKTISSAKMWFFSDSPHDPRDTGRTSVNESTFWCFSVLIFIVLSINFS